METACGWALFTSSRRIMLLSSLVEVKVGCLRREVGGGIRKKWDVGLSSKFRLCYVKIQK